MDKQIFALRCGDDTAVAEFHQDAPRRLARRGGDDAFACRFESGECGLGARLVGFVGGEHHRQYPLRGEHMRSPLHQVVQTERLLMAGDATGIVGSLGASREKWRVGNNYIVNARFAGSGKFPEIGL